MWYKLHLSDIIVQSYFSGPQGTWSVHVCCLHLEMEFRSWRQWASLVWHHLLLLMNGFNKTEAAVFSCWLSFLRAFPFISLILLTTAGVKCLCGGCKKSPRTTSLCSHIFSGPQGSWSVHVCCSHLEMDFRSCARGRQWCGIIHYY